MTTNQFRKLALGLPETVEAEHMNHPDFRVGGKIFATIWPDDKWGMVKLKPEQQASFCKLDPDVFQPVKGGWGRQGATQIRLAKAVKAKVIRALAAAWRNTASKSIQARYSELIPPAEEGTP